MKEPAWAKLKGISVMMCEVKDFISQGYTFCLMEDSIVYLSFQMKDRIDSELLEKAVNLALSRCSFFRMGIELIDDDYVAVTTEAEYKVNYGTERRKIPDETNGYLFDIHCEGDFIFFDYHHFLADGRGIHLFISEILVSYVNLYYGINLEEKALTSDEMYDIDALIAEHYKERNGLSNTSGKKGYCNTDGYRRSVIEIPFSAIRSLSKENQVRNFSSLVAIFTQAFSQWTNSSDVRICYIADARGAVGKPGALYNCVINIIGTVSTRGTSLCELMSITNEEINKALSKDELLKLLADGMNWSRKLEKMDCSLKKKKRIYQMGESLRSSADLYFSHVGNVFYGAPEEISTYVKNAECWAPAIETPCCTTSIISGDKLILCLMYVEELSGIVEKVLQTFHELNIEAVRRDI